MASERDRLDSADRAAWLRWGPYLSERAWGTVREDYSGDGQAWNYLPHDHARSRVYRWSEDGLLGICDDQQRLCFALALWNGRDPIVKERLFGLGGTEGNHGEDVKEYYYYLDSTPTHSYMKALYKYPQAAYPYASLVDTNRRRTRLDAEFELMDTGVFAGDRYFDVFVEYAKAAPRDILIRITAINRGPEPARLDLLPTLWFRNTWSWDDEGARTRPTLRYGNTENEVIADHPTLGRYVLACERPAGGSFGEPRTPSMRGGAEAVAGTGSPGPAAILFTENETNTERLFGTPNKYAFVKDGIHEAVVNGRIEATNPGGVGTKAAVHSPLQVAAGAEVTVRLRLFNPRFHPNDTPFEGFDAAVLHCQHEADEFYAALQPANMSADRRSIQRQAFAGMLWSKQFYRYDVTRWLKGDPAQPPPPPERASGRNAEWRHLNNFDVISMPDKWEYPWYASWDLAFHCLPLALLDPEFAKQQLILLGREWYQHPNGQIPAYEWSFGDVNPPVLAWAAWRVYKIEEKMRGMGQHGDLNFLEKVFHKLLLNFTWWVNRKDSEGNNVFQGGFLGLDNIGVFDRSAPLPTGGRLEQSDGTSWMGMFCLNMLTIALELARYDRVYEDIATKFFEHFLYIAEAMNNIAGEGIELWDPDDEFFYDVLHLESDANVRLKIHSIVGLIPLFAVTTIEPQLLDMLPAFKTRLEWFLKNRPDLSRLVSRWYEAGMGERRLLAITRGHRMKSVLRRMLDPGEFLSDYGVRALSRYHRDHPFRLTLSGQQYAVDYEPAESAGGLFGGNSNWRGPIWLPINYLIIEALQQFHHYYGEDFKVECPTGSGNLITLDQIADELSNRLIRIFELDRDGRRPFLGDHEQFQRDPHWRDYLLYYEYFHGDNGAGLGAAHQTGWTGLIAKVIQQQGSKTHAAGA
jgi:hypothetical protein